MDSERKINWLNDQKAVDYFLNNRTFPALDGTMGYKQFSPYVASDPVNAGRNLQVKVTGGENRWNNCQIRIGMKTKSVADDMYASLAQKTGHKEFFEFRTRAYPENGVGGKVQVELRNLTDVPIETLERWNPNTKVWDRLF